MAWLTGAIAFCKGFFKIFLFFSSIYTEKNKKKAEEKKALGKELVDAMAETNKARRASHVSAVVVKLRK
jgi:hypothetical protein